MPARATILLADDHVLLLEAFRRMLEPAFAVRGRCGTTLPVAALQPGKYQPRTHMDQEALDALAASIKTRRV